MELTNIIKEIQANGFINVKRLQLRGRISAITAMTKIMATTSAQEKEPEWWTIRAKILAIDKDRNYFQANESIEKRLFERRN